MPPVAGRATPMAVPASHHTAIDLRDETRHAAAARCEVRHVRGLSRDMIELEDAQLRCAAVDATGARQDRVGEVQVPPFVGQPGARG